VCVVESEDKDNDAKVNSHICLDGVLGYSVPLKGLVS